MKFKIGDRVKCILPEHMSLTKDKLYYIEDIDDGLYTVINNRGDECNYTERRFELYRKENQTEVDFLDNIQRNMQE